MRDNLMVCKGCGQYKGPEEFYWSKAANRHYKRCKPCHNKQVREAYLRKNPRQLENAKKRTEARRRVREARISSHSRRRGEFLFNVKSNVNSVIYRCQRLGLQCDIDVNYIVDLFERQHGRCALTGRIFVWGVGRNRDCISLDRIKPELGYTRGNIRLITLQANLARSNWSDADLIEMAVGLINTIGGVQLDAAE